MKQRMVAAAGIVFLLSFWVIAPASQHRLGTSKNISVTILAQPFLDGPELVYRWSGDIFRACPIELRRTITDSEEVVTTLAPVVYGTMPSELLGHQDIEIVVTVPRAISEGEAVYRVVEVPHCGWTQWLFPVTVAYPDVVFQVTRDPSTNP